MAGTPGGLQLIDRPRPGARRAGAESGRGGCRRWTRHPLASARAALLLTALASCTPSFYLDHGIRTRPLPIQRSPDYRGLNSQQQDVAYLSALLLETFPTPPERIYPGGGFLAARDELLRRLATPVAPDELKLLLARFLAGTSSEHTWLARLDSDEDARVFPLRLTGGRKVYIATVGTGMDGDLLGAEVTSLGGHPPEEALRCLAAYCFGDNDGSRREQALGRAASHLFAAACGLTGSRGELRLQVKRRDGASREVIFDNAPRRAVRFRPIRRAPPGPGSVESIDSIGPSAEPFYFRLDPRRGFAYLRLGTMLDRTALIDSSRDFVAPLLSPLAKLYAYGLSLHNHTPRLAPLLQRLFGEIHRQGIRHLILDLRGNGGGDERLGKQFLYFLAIHGENGEPRDFEEYVRLSPTYKRQYRTAWLRYARLYRERHHRPPPDGELLRIDDLGGRPEKGGSAFFRDVEDPASPMHIPAPAHRFGGTLFVLIDSRTQSAAMDLATLIADNHLGVLVGTPTGARPTGPTEVSFHRLPNSRLPFSLSVEYDVRPDPSRNEESALLPDETVEVDYPDFLAGRDPQLARVLELIDKRR